MKNQNDLIATIVCVVLTLIVTVLCFTVFKRQEIPVTQPATVATAVPPLPANPPVMAASLPSGGGQSGGRGGNLPSFGGPSSGGGMSAPGAAGPAKAPGH